MVALLQSFFQTERENSAISPVLWTANAFWVGSDDMDPETGLPLPYTYVLYAGGFSRFANYYSNSLDGKWSHLRAGGIWFPGYKIGDGSWGQFKPVTPRLKHNGNKLKYETPPKTPAGLLWPFLPDGFPLGDFVPSGDSSRSRWESLARSGLPLIITEGAKKALAIVSAGYPAVALPGDSMGYRNGFGADRHLIPELVEILSLGWSDVYVAFDQDTKSKTQKEVGQAARRLANLISQNIRGRCRLLTWSPRQGKGIDDYLAAGGQISTLIEDSNHFLLTEWRRRREFRASVPLEASPYLPDVPLPSQKLIALKAPKGTGKTELMSRWHKQTEAEGLSILLSHRVQLGENLANRFGLPFNNSMTDDDRRYAKHLGFGCCIDSLFARSKMHWEDGDWLDGATVYIDEAEQFLTHLLTSDTLKFNRAEVLQNFTLLLRRAARLIVADADLSPVSLDFFEYLLGCSNPYLGTDSANSVVFEAKSNSSERVAVFARDPEQVLRNLYRRLKAGQRGLLLTGAQKSSSRFSASGIAKLVRAKFPTKKILILDSETVARGETQGFIAKGFPDIADYDLVIASPVIETGIDLHPKLGINWQFVCAIGHGIQSPEQFCQALARYRGDCPRIIYVPRMAANCFFSLGSEIWPSKIKSAVADFFDSLEMSEWVLFGPYLATFNNLVARGNLGRKCYRSAIEWLLKADGYSVCSLDDEVKMEMRLVDELAAIRDAAVAEDVAAALAADDIGADEARMISESFSRTTEESNKLKRFIAKSRYGAVTETLLLADLDGAYPALRLHYLSSLGSAAGMSKPVGADKIEFLPDRITERRRELQAESVRALPVLSLIGGGRFKPDDPRLQVLAKIDARSFNLVWGSCQLTRNTGLSRFRCIARSLGFDVRSYRFRPRSGGKVERHYYCCSRWPEIDRAALWEYWATASPPSLVGESWNLDLDFDEAG